VRRAAGSLRRLHEWLELRPGVGLAATCGLAFAVVGLLVGPVVLVHPDRATVGVSPSSDFQVMTWSLRWWPWALTHGVDPLHTPLLWPPYGFSALWMTTIPVLALVAWPVTATVGPLVAYNVLMLAAVALAAGSAYLLCRELTGRLLPSLVGGLLFGLSPYMLGHLLSDHLDLVFVFPLPLLALLVVRLVRGKTSGGRFLVGFVALLLVLLGVSFELFLDFALLAAIGCVIAFVGSWKLRSRIARPVGLVALAYLACVPVLVPLAVVAFSSAHAPLRYAPSGFATDILNVVTPTPTLLVGRSLWLRRVSEHFVGNIGEQDGYLGLPLLVVAVLAARAQWRRGGWLIGGLLAAALLLSLGPILTAGGRPVMTLPFAMSRLPVFGSALPARMSLFAALAAACLCALWLAQPGRSWLRALVAVIVVVSLLPNFWAGSRLAGAWSNSAAFGWSSDRVSNGFVADRSWQRTIEPGSTVLVLPTGDRTPASYWQAETGMRFRLAVPATPFVPPAIGGSPVVSGLVDNDLPALAGRALASARLRAFLIADHVSDVVVAAPIGARWRGIVATATATRPSKAGTTDVYPVRAGLRPLMPRSTPLLLHAKPMEDEFIARRVASTLGIQVIYDGRRGHLHAWLTGPGGGARRRAVALSSSGGDVFFPTGAVDSRGRAAIAFVELRRGRDLLRLATDLAGKWKVVTLDHSSQPVWSPRVEILSSGAVVTAWIDENDPTRTVKAAILTPSGLRREIALDRATNIGSLALGAADDRAVCAWADAVAGEKRVRVSILDRGRWRAPVTIAASLDPLGYVRLNGPDSGTLRWADTANPAHVRVFEASLRGTNWRSRLVSGTEPPRAERSASRRPFTLRPALAKEHSTTS